MQPYYSSEGMYRTCLPAIKQGSDSRRGFRTVWYALMWVCLLCISGVSEFHANAFSIQTYGVEVALEKDEIIHKTNQYIDSLCQYNWDGKPLPVYKQVSQVVPFKNDALDFYLLLLLIAVPGIIRLAFPRYFSGLWQMLKNPLMWHRQQKERIQAAKLPNILMNIFFAFSLAAYGYYAVQYVNPSLRYTLHPYWQFILILAGVWAIFWLKCGVVIFSGWAFKVEQATGNYLFNVHFTAKILSLVILPCTMMLAFGSPLWQLVSLIASCVIMFILILSTYFKSWEVFGVFFQYSKFHFFMYLCASELLPLAVLVKVLVRSLFQEN